MATIRQTKKHCMLDVYHKRHHTINIKKLTCTFPDIIKIHVYWSNSSNNNIIIDNIRTNTKCENTLSVFVHLIFNMNLKPTATFNLWPGSCQSDLFLKT